MAIKYPYLGDGSPFNAESLNVRFDSLMGPASGVNAIGSPEVSRGAFRHNHLPSLVGHAGRDMARTAFLRGRMEFSTEASPLPVVHF